MSPEALKQGIVPLPLGPGRGRQNDVIHRGHCRIAIKHRGSAWLDTNVWPRLELAV